MAKCEDKVLKRLEKVCRVGFVLVRERMGASGEGRVSGSGEGVGAGSDGGLVEASFGRFLVEGARSALAGTLHGRPLRLVGGDGCLGGLKLSI